MIRRGKIGPPAVTDGGLIDPEVADLQLGASRALDDLLGKVPAPVSAELAAELARAELFAKIAAEFERAFFRPAVDCCGLSHYQIEQLAKCWFRFRRRASRSAASDVEPALTST